MDYIVPGCEPSVVMARHLQPSGMPERMDAALCERLSQGGISRLIVGHTPCEAAA